MSLDEARSLAEATASSLDRLRRVRRPEELLCPLVSPAEELDALVQYLWDVHGVPPGAGMRLGTRSAIRKGTKGVIHSFLSAPAADTSVWKATVL